jgi:AbrB family looped-hinge helix DNA binding protein
MEAITAEVDREYQIVIPEKVRALLNVQPQDTVLFLLEGDAIVLRARPENFTATLRGLHRELWAEDESWLEQERASWE